MQGLLLLLVFLVDVAFAQTAAPPEPAKPAPSRINRPALDGTSFDVGLYELRPSAADKTLPTFISDAREFELKKGLVFGYVFQLSGFTGTRLVPIRTVTTHPPLIRKSKGETTPTTQFEEKTFFKPINGTTKWPMLYRFDLEEEMVPGEWGLSVYYDTQLVAEHKFTVLKPK